MLSGPIVRRATVDSIWFWIALSEKISDISASIFNYNDHGQRLNEILVQTPTVNVVRLGKNISGLCKIVPSSNWFPTDTILGYDLNLVTEGPTSTNTRLLSELSLDLNYKPFDLPTLIIGNANTNIVHGSCRRPGSEKKKIRIP